MDFRDVDIAEVRDFWDARPCNVRHSPAAYGTRRYFDEVEKRKYLVEPHIPGFAAFESWKDRRVLEVGCGIGTDTVGFARAGADVTAVDLSPASLDIARRRAEVLGLANIRFVQADVERLSEALPVEPYDLVYSFGVIHHTPRPEAALRQLRQYLEPGGTLKLMVYHRYSWKVLSILFGQRGGVRRDIDSLVARYSEAQTGCPVTYTFGRRRIRELVESAGFELRDAFVDHIFPYVVRDYLRYRYTVVPWFAWMPGPAFRWLERRLGWHLCVTASAVDPC